MEEYTQIDYVRGDGEYFCSKEGGMCSECLESGYQPVYYCAWCEYMHYAPEE